MRLEVTGARTWLLAIFAGLAVLAYGLSLLGVGGHIMSSGELVDTPAPAQVAHLGETPPERPGPIEQYAAIAARSVFSSDRSPQEFRLVSETSPAQALDVRLTGVLITPKIRLATLRTSSGDSLRLRQGGADVGGWRLVSVEPRAAIVEGPGGTRHLELQVEGGSQEVGMAGPPVVPPSGPASRSPAGQEAAGGRTVNPAVVPPPAGAVAPGSAVTPEERIESIRRQIEERRRQLQQGQGGASASNR